MYLTRIEVEGFRGAESRVIEAPDRVASLPDPPEGCAIADAIDLLASGLDQRRMPAVAARLGWATAQTEVIGNEGDRELNHLHPPAVDAILAPETRSLTIDATLALDPPLFGRLRQHAARDPRMVTALGHDPSVGIKVGWLANRDRTSAHPSILSVRVGDIRFETSGKERPHWLPELLVELGARFGRLDRSLDAAALAERLLDASLSPDPARRAGAEALIAAVSAPPFSLPRPQVVRALDRLELVFGPGLIRARQMDRAAVDAVRLAEAAFVGRPDVLVADGVRMEPSVREWLGTLPERSDAPVEQVWAT